MQHVTQDHFSLSLVEIFKICLCTISHFHFTKWSPLFSGTELLPLSQKTLFHCGKIYDLCHDEEPTDDQELPKLCILDSCPPVVEQPPVQPQLSQAASPSQTLSQNIPELGGTHRDPHSNSKLKAVQGVSGSGSQQCWAAVLQPKEAATSPAQPRNCSSSLCVQ